MKFYEKMYVGGGEIIGWINQCEKGDIKNYHSIFKEDIILEMLLV